MIRNDYQVPPTKENGLLAELAVKQFLSERYTFEFQQLETFFDTPVERQMDFPGSREDLGIFHGRLVSDMVLVRERIALHYMKAVAREIPGSIKPRFAIQASDIHYQRVAFPMPVRHAQPAIGAGLTWLSHVHLSICGCILVDEQNVLWIGRSETGRADK